MPKSELLWTLADYAAANQEPPASLRENPQLCEGDLMTADEVAEFVKDSIATLRILKDKNSPRYEELVAIYRDDLAALVQLGQMDEDEYMELIDDSNLSF